MSQATTDMTGSVMNANTTHYTPGALPQQIMALTDRYAVLHPDLAQQIVNDIASQVISPQSVLSFDVFDTLLLRNHQSELRRFVDLSAQVATYLATTLHRQISQYDVLSGRLLANRLSYRLSPMREGCREGTIDDIYRTTLMQLDIDPTDSLIDACINIEITYEITQLTVNYPLIDLIRRHLQGGGQAIYISDMYLRSTHINQLFTRLGVDPSLFVATYSSADTILSKRSGKIWPWICQELSIQKHDIVHVGDSLVSDYQSPMTYGIAAVHVPIPLQMRRDIMADHGVMIHQLESLHLPIQSWMAPPHW